MMPRLLAIGAVCLALVLGSYAACAADLDGIEHVALSDDGKLAVLADKEGRIHLYDPARKTHFRSVSAYPAGRVASALAVRTEGELVATSGDPNLPVIVWNMTAGREIRRLTEKVGATRLAFSPDGKQLAGSLTDGRLTIWSVPELREVSVLNNVFAVEVLEWSNNGKLLAAASNRSELIVWFPSRDKTLLKALAAPESFSIFGMAFSPDGRQLFTVSRRNFGLWDVAAGKLAKSIEGNTDRSLGVAWNAAKDEAVDLTEKAFRMWNLKTGEVTRKLPADVTPRDAHFSRDGTIALVRERQNFKSSGIVVRDLASELDWPSGTAATTVATTKPGAPPAGETTSPVAAVALPKLKPGEKKLGQTHLGDEIVRIAPVSATPVSKPAKPSANSPVDLRAAITGVGLTDDGKTIIAGGREGQVFVGDFDTGKTRARFWIADNERLSWVQPSPDGKMFIAERDGANVAELWSEKGEPLAVIPTDDSLTGVAFSPKGTFVALALDDSVLLFRLGDRTVYATLQLRPVVQSVAVSPNEELVAVGFPQTVCVWNVKEDRLQWCSQVAQLGITALAFSPDGKYLAAGDSSAAGMVYLCDMEGTVVASHSSGSAITAVAFQTPQRVIFANGGSKELTVLSVPDAKVVETFPHPSAGMANPIYDRFVFSRNGRRAVWNQGRNSPLPDLKPWKAEK